MLFLLTYRKFNQLVFWRELLSPYREKKSRGQILQYDRLSVPLLRVLFNPG